MSILSSELTGVRSRFPALQRVFDERPVVYFDGPGGSQMPASVIERMAGYLRGGVANEDGAFITSSETDSLVAAARVAMAEFMGSEPDEIAFGANATTLNFLLAHAVARTLDMGDEVVVTVLDHEANQSPWHAVAADHGLIVREAPIRPQDASLDVDALEGLLGPRTRVVAFTLASNAVGSIPDAARIVAAAHAHGALAWADGVHLAPHRRLDRRALGLDVLLCSPYKFFGPHLGVAAIRRELAQTWPADRVRVAAQTPAGHRFETGTVSHEALAGTIAAVDYVESLGGEGSSARERLEVAYAAIREHEEALSARFLTEIADLPAVTIHGLNDPSDVGSRTPTFCLTVDGFAPRRVCEVLGRAGIFAWDGHYYAGRLMESLGLDSHGGAVRVGFLHYSTQEEVSRLLDALASLAVTGGA